ncbi:MAG: DinB family protein [Anaerolineae bacterium]|nr:DinB family protein [Anaerolineae bacterium]
MIDIKTFRKAWSAQQKELRAALNDKTQQAHAIDLFMQQHSVLHSAKVSPVDWSYEDDLLDDLPEDKWRRIPPNGEHSIAWNIWLLARIEDATMNLLVAGQPQLFNEDNWQQRLNAPFINSGNDIPMADVVKLSEEVDVVALREYRTAVGKRTQVIISTLPFTDFKQKTEADRLQQIMDEGVLVPEAGSILEYWSRCTLAGLLLMPPTRHNLVHLNEVYTLKQRKL